MLLKRCTQACSSVGELGRGPRGPRAAARAAPRRRACVAQLLTCWQRQAPHPAASLRFEDCKVPVANRIGEAGQGFKAAMAAFDIFRPSVGAAGVGLARRALNETLAHTEQRRLFGKPMHGLEGVQMALADMATDLEGAALLVYRAAWAHDVRGERGAYEACMAKLAGSEAAGRIVDRAVQLLGGKGVTRGHIIEQLYREARPMRIYEGASEIQKLVIARNLIKSHAQLG